jgi:signal transduction histidine kinase
VAGQPDPAPLEADEVRRLVPGFAIVVAVVAAVADPGSAADLVLVALPVATFGLWAFAPRVPLAAIALGAIVPVVAAQRSGHLEPLTFDVSLLGFVVGRWSSSAATAVVLGLLAAASPAVVAAIQDPAEMSVGVWILGIAFPWAIGRALARQAQLAAQLANSRRELAEQALLSERRRIARDVHDFVGHGLAAVMLQITSARHVLRRDPASAEEALRSAEEVGRRSMRELRRTVALLRSDDEARVAPPPPTAREIRTLVDEARAGGLAVELRTQGDISLIPDGVGLALYRIAQEALANAARHAPRERTVVGLELSGNDVRLVAETSGRASPGRPGRGGYGLIGMRERATRSAASSWPARPPTAGA